MLHFRYVYHRYHMIETIGQVVNNLDRTGLTHHSAQTTSNTSNHCLQYQSSRTVLIKFGKWPPSIPHDDLLICCGCGAQYEVTEKEGKTSCRICDVRTYLCLIPIQVTRFPRSVHSVLFLFHPIFAPSSSLITLHSLACSPPSRLPLPIHLPNN